MTGLKISDIDFDLLVQAVIQAESGGNPLAHSAVGAKGLMQLMDRTGQEWHQRLQIKEPYDPFNPEQNLKIGRAYLKWLIEQFDFDVELALAAYNWGIGKVGKVLNVTKVPASSFDHIKMLLPDETAQYVPKVLSKYRALEKEASIAI